MGFNWLRLEEGENKILNYLKDSEADIICLQSITTTDRSLLTQRMIDRALKEYKYKEYTKRRRKKQLQQNSLLFEISYIEFKSPSLRKLIQRVGKL